MNDPNSGGVCGNGNTDVTSPGGFYWVGCGACSEQARLNHATRDRTSTLDPLRNVPVPPCRRCDKRARRRREHALQASTRPSLPITDDDPAIRRIYVITGGITMKQNGTLLRARGVMIYFTCSKYPTPCNAMASASDAGFSGNGGIVGTTGRAIAAPTSGHVQRTAHLRGSGTTLQTGHGRSSAVTGTSRTT